MRVKLFILLSIGIWWICVGYRCVRTTSSLKVLGSSHGGCVGQLITLDGCRLAFVIATPTHLPS